MNKQLTKKEGGH